MSSIFSQDEAKEASYSQDSGPRWAVAVSRCSGLLGSAGQLLDLPAVDYLQRISSGLAELGVQSAAQVIGWDVWEGVKADDDPILWGWLTLWVRGKIPSPPPKVRASLQFQISVGLGVVWLLSLRY